MQQRHIVHLDMDTFFVSVERCLDPTLRGRPVIVGSDNPHGRGVVAAASYEARRYGVHSAMALRHAWRLCPEARFVAGHPEAYGEASRRVRAFCEEWAPVVEMASVDEAYLDLTGTDRLYPSPGWVADRIETQIAEDLELPVSFGWGENKLLSKVASARSKPHGMLRVYPGQGRAFLAPLALRCLPGIGPKNAGRLERYGLTRIGDLERLGERRLVDAFGENGRVLYHRALGEDASPVQAQRARQSVGREHTFETDTGDMDLLRSTLSLLAEKVGDALRRTGKNARRVTLKLRYSDFKTISRSAPLTTPTNDDRLLYHAAAAALEAAYSRRVRIRLVGIGASGLTGASWATLDLFRADAEEQMARLGRGLDAIRQRYGFHSILRGRSYLQCRDRSSA